MNGEMLWDLSKSCHEGRPTACAAEVVVPDFPGNQVWCSKVTGDVYYLTKETTFPAIPKAGNSCVREPW
jgi:hypothetical protein